MSDQQEYWEKKYWNMRREGISLSGYYNRNYRCGSQSGEVVIRVPIKDAPVMDLTLLPEPISMRAAAVVGVRTPELIYVSEKPPFQVHQFINGKTLRKWSEQYPLETQTYRSIAELLVSVWRTPTDEMLPYQAHLFDSVSSQSFWDLLLKRFEAIYHQHAPQFAPLFYKLGVPADPFQPIRHWGASLHSRPSVLAHCDLHPDNILVGRDALWALDWGLALVCDPAYDIAMHLHKMSYTTEEEAAAIAAFQVADSRTREAEFLQDLVRWRGLEQVKSVIVDVVRCWREIHEPGKSLKNQERIAAKLAQRLHNTEHIWNHQHWGARHLLILLTEYEPPEVDVAPQFPPN